ncbi:hypothetical protein [Aureispira anguillae]|uniref:Uncharacterized protein n=1 Tax=Aureispira anguillae TaxID=2864201 RepID=A0A915YJU9_9BACT|nr:hypothetical protein [Aureispira anguillae]BDS14534.1 hypothetical protein AsAng_0053140 [Aureispira anguillae]
MKTPILFFILLLAFNHGLIATPSICKKVNFNNSEKKTEPLLMRKWVNGEIYIDLKIDGSFYAKLDQSNLIEGIWAMSKDQKKLILKEEQMLEGKGKSFKVEYTIVAISSHNMVLQNQEGEELLFITSELALSRLLSQKWVFEQGYIDLNPLGTFEASINHHDISGKWGFSSEIESKKTLKLVQIDSKTQEVFFNKTYQLISLTHNKLVMLDPTGNIIQLFSKPKHKLN